MPLDTYVPRDGYIAELGVYLRCNTGSGSTNRPGLVALGIDPIGIALGGSILSYGTFRIEGALGHFQATEDQRLDLLRTKPNTRRYDGARDGSRYGGYLTNMMVAARVFNGSKIFYDVPTRERDTYHVTTRGSVGPTHPDQGAFIVPSTSLNWKPTVWAGVATGTGFRYSSQSTGYHQVQFAPLGSYVEYSRYLTSLPSWATNRRTLATIEDIETGRYWGVGSYSQGSANPTLVMALTAFAVEQDPGHSVEVSYTLEARSWGTGNFGTTVWNCKFKHHVRSQRVGTVHPSVAGTASVDGALDCVEHWSGTCISASNVAKSQLWFGSLGVPGNGYSRDFTLGSSYLLGPTVLLSEVVPIGPSLSDEALGKVPKLMSPSNFEWNVGLRQSDILCSAYQSTASAMEELESGINTNLIEQLSQLSGIADYLPRLRDSLSIVRSLSGGNLPGTVKGVLDLVAELRLRYAFSYAPDFDFITATLPIIGKVASRLSSTGTEVVIARGLFEFDFEPGEFNREESHLVTRTKVVAKRDNDSVLAKVLGVDSLGLLPSSSNAWDLVPLSFVLDWIVDIRSRLTDFERSMYMIALGPSYLVHSYKVWTPITSSELSAANLQAWPNSAGETIKPEWRVYARHVSRHIPPPRSGRYDFRMPSRPPNWATAGSLGWKILF